MNISDKKSYKKGFTLVELLVVISIVSLLASVILASVSSTRAKATVAATKQFYNSAYHKMGANAVLSVDFNEGGTATPIDATGNFSTCTANCSPTHANDDPIRGTSGYSLNNTSNTSGTTLTSGSSIVLTTGVSVSIWFKRPAGVAGAEYLIWNGNGGYNVFYSFSTNAFYCSMLGAANFGFVDTSGAISDNQWHNVVCDYDDVHDKISAYLDGKSVYSASGSYTLSSYPLLSSVTMGGRGLAILNFLGYIDNVQVFSDSLTAFEVQKLYALGAIRHGLVVR